MGQLLTLEQAAELIGVSTDELRLSRQRGLPPGNLGTALRGRVYFDRDDLIPAKKSSRRDKVISDPPKAKHLGGGWYELGDGTRVRGKKAAGL